MVLFFYSLFAFFLQVFFFCLSNLNDKILSPLVGHLKKPRLIFVSDEILQYIPMAALPMPDNEKKQNKAYDPLVNHFQILSVSSASALPFIRTEKSRADRPDKLVAIFADPVFSADDPRFTLFVPAQDDSSELIVFANLDKALHESGVRTRSDLSRLPFSRMEANYIVTLAGREECQCFLDFDANFSQGEEIRTQNQYLYFLAIARNVLFEYLKSQKKKSSSLDELPPSQMPYIDPDEIENEQLREELWQKRLGCMKRCLQTLPEEKRVLITGYYQGERRTKIENRQKLAQWLQLSEKVLRIRTHRIPDELETCIKGCMKKIRKLMK